MSGCGVLLSCLVSRSGLWLILVFWLMAFREEPSGLQISDHEA